MTLIETVGTPSVQRGPAQRVDNSPARHPPRSALALAWRQFRRHRLALVGFIMFGLLCLSALAAPLSPYDPNRTSLLTRFEPPSLAHPMGTDDLGRDELTRVLMGGRVSLLVGITAMAVSILVGTALGALAGYFGGRLDSLLMRLTEAFIAFPQLFLLILLAALFGTGLWTIVLVVGLLRWMPVARLVRAAFLQLKQQEYVTAARALGASTSSVMVRHILPNAMSPIIVAATLGVAGAILTESTLSFLGLGIQLPTATWGNMLRAAQNDMTTAPWLAFFPGLFIFLTILSVNYIGDGLRDALDPRKT
jgi:peptide/nickel transport system permease protein